MPLVLADRVRETTTTAGTGTVTLAGAVTGYQTFAAVGNGNTTYYCIAGQGTSEWEVGIGTYTSSGTTLSRDTVLASSAGGAKVTFSAGTKDVFVTYPSGKSINEDASDNVGIGTTTPAAKLDIASGNLLFSSTAQRITGDMSNATVANRLAFQSSTTNGATQVNLIPNGTSVDARWFSYANSADLANSQFAAFGVVNGENRITSGITGAASYAPMTFYTGGSERVRVDTSGNVGVGTSTINALVQLKNNVGTAGAANQIRLYEAGASIFGFGVSAGQLDYRGSAHVFYSDTATERMRIDSSGNVGIGTASPTGPLSIRSASSSHIVLDVTGTSDDWGIAVESSTKRFYINEPGTGERLSILQGGNVGIGTTSPSVRLQATNTSGEVFRLTNTTATERLHFYTRNAAGTSRVESQNSDLQLFAADAFPVTFGTTNTERMRIDTSGNVGIGTASFSNRLTAQVAVDGLSVISYFRNLSNVSANTAAAIDLVADQASSRLTTLRDAGGTSATLVFSNTAAGVMGERMRIDSSGRVGIGRTPSVTLDVNGPIWSRYTAAVGYAQLYMPGGYSQFGKDSGQRTDILNTGGLDSTSPFWTGYQWCPPDAITNSGGATSFPRTSFYFNYSTVTNPSNMAFNMYVGNNNGIPIGITIGTESAGAISFVTNGSTRFVFNSVGALGVGTGVSYGSSGQVLTSAGSGASPTWQTISSAPTLNVVTGTTQAAVAGNHYVLTNAAATTLTLPASPAAGDIVWVTARNGLTTNVVARNGQNIQNLAEDMTLNAQYAAVQFRYINSTIGWTFV